MSRPDIRCLKCQSTNITTERRPEGDSMCGDCGYQGLTQSFVVSRSEMKRHNALNGRPIDYGLKPEQDPLLKLGFDHPCKQTCSGWRQGFERGQAESEEKWLREREWLDKRIKDLEERADFLYSVRDRQKQAIADLQRQLDVVNK